MTWHAYEVAVKTMQHMYKGELWVRGRSLGQSHCSSARKVELPLASGGLPGSQLPTVSGSTGSSLRAAHSFILYGRSWIKSTQLPVLAQTSCPGRLAEIVTTQRPHVGRRAP